MANKIIQNFYLGQQYDDNDPVGAGYSYAENFKLDGISSLKPTYYKDSSTENTYEVFNLARDSGGRVWRLGNGGGSSNPNNGYIDNFVSGWTSVSTGSGAVPSVTNKTLTFYKEYMYFAGNNYLMRFGPVPANTIDNTYKAITNTITGKGVIGKDDVLYFPTDNSLTSLEGTTLTEDVISVPTDYTIKQLAIFQNTLAVAVDANDAREAGVFFWDYINADFIDFIPFGSGDLVGMANINGMLVVGLTYNIKDYQVLEMIGYNGGAPTSLGKIKMQFLDSFSKFKSINGSIYFSARSDQSSLASARYGLWEFGRADSRTPFAFNQIARDDDWKQELSDFEFLGEGFVVLYRTATDYKISLIYRLSSDGFVETNWLRPEDISKRAQMKSVTLIHSPINSGDTVTISAKTDEDSSYTTLLASTEADSLRTTATFTAAGDNLPSFGRVKIKAKSSGTNGGITLYGIKIDYEDITDDSYGR